MTVTYYLTLSVSGFAAEVNKDKPVLTATKEGPMCSIDFSGRKFEG